MQLREKNHIYTRDDNNKGIEKGIKYKQFSISLLIILILSGIILTNIPQVVNAKKMETNKSIYDFLDYGDDDTSWDIDLCVVYDLLVNGSRTPVNKTFLQIPEQNDSIMYQQTKNKSETVSTWLTLELSNIIYHSDVLENHTPYYSSIIKLDYVYSPIKKKLDTLIKGTMNPFKIRNYVVNYFYQFLSIFATSNNSVKDAIAYKDTLYYWGPYSLPTFVFKNNSELLPLIGPRDESFYENLKNEVLNIKDRLTSNNGWKNNVTTYFQYAYVGDPVPYPHNSSSFYYSQGVILIFNTSLFIDTEKYNASITIDSTLYLNDIKNDKIITGDNDFFVWINFYDKETNTNVTLFKDIFISNAPDYYYAGGEDEYTRRSFDVFDMIDLLPLILFPISIILLPLISKKK